MSIAAPQSLVLVVEDDAGIRESLRDVLEFGGYRVIEAIHGKNALEILEKSERPRLILLDMKMPIMGGREFLDRIRLDAKLASIPVVVVSATADAESIRGSTGFVRKPVELDHLLAIVAQQVSTSS